MFHFDPFARKFRNPARHDCVFIAQGMAQADGIGASVLNPRGPRLSKERFWDEFKDVRAAMLAVGDARHVPMSPYPDREAGLIWFITAEGTDIVDAAAAGAAEASLIVTGNGSFHARIDGRASLSEDRTKLEELWNPIADAWFDGIDDPDVRLLRLAPATAEFWTTSGAVGFMFQIAKANLTGGEPDIGDHFRLTF